MFTATLTEKEMDLLVNLLDVSVKAGGLRNASPALVLIQKFTKVESPDPEVKDE